MGRVAYLFPGQGSQEVGMGRLFADTVPQARACFEQVDDALGFSLSDLIWQGPAERLTLTEHTQPAVLVTSVAALQAARRAGLPPADFVAGHSLGEYSALVAAGVLSLEDAARLVRLRGRFMQEAVPAGVGSMAAVLGLSADRVAEACREAEADLPGQMVVPANLNGPEQTVIAGHAEAVVRAGERCREKGARRALPLEVSAPFHSPLMQPVVARLAAEFERAVFQDAQIPLVSNVAAAPETSAGQLRALLLEQVTAAVRWTEVVARLAAEGCDTFVELGPGSVLSGLVKRQVKGAKVVSVGEPAKLDQALAQLAA